MRERRRRHRPPAAGLVGRSCWPPSQGAWLEALRPAWPSWIAELDRRLHAHGAQHLGQRRFCRVVVQARGQPLVMRPSRSTAVASTISRSSTPSRTRRPCWRPGRSCRSSAPSPPPPASGSTRATSRWPAGACRFSGASERTTARSGHPCRARPADAAARHQHHQAAQHQRVGGAAARPASRSCRTRATLPDYPDDPKTDEEKAHPGALRQVHGQRGEPGAARRQLGPPRAARGQGIRAQEPACDG
jgi:hypothetical protein